MAGKRLKGIVGVMVAGSMFASSTAAAASQQISPWATLTVLTGGAPAAAVCGAAAGVAAAQPTSGCVLPVMDTPPPVANVPPPPPPVAPLATESLHCSSAWSQSQPRSGSIWQCMVTATATLCPSAPVDDRSVAF